MPTVASGESLGRDRRLRAYAHGVAHAAPRRPAARRHYSCDRTRQVASRNGAGSRLDEAELAALLDAILRRYDVSTEPADSFRQSTRRELFGIPGSAARRSIRTSAAHCVELRRVGARSIASSASKISPPKLSAKCGRGRVYRLRGTLAR